MPEKSVRPDGGDETASTNEASGRTWPHPMEVVIAIVFVAVISLGATSGFVNTRDETTTHVAQAISLDLSAPGTVQIVPAHAETISVEKRTRDLWGKVTTSEQVREETLTIESRCTRRRTVILGDCRADYVIKAPTSTEISGAATNGRVEVKGMRSAVVLTTSNAAISATEVEGPVHLRTSNGDITVANTTGSLVLDANNGRIGVIEARATRVDASTTNRPISITLTTSPRRVVAKTRNADIDIEVPADSSAYAMELTASNGTTRVDGIVDDPNASQSIQATTQNGDISIRGSASGALTPRTWPVSAT